MTINILAETNSLPLKIGRVPKGKDRLPIIHFQVQFVSFRGVYIKSHFCSKRWSKTQIVYNSGQTLATSAEVTR